MKFRTRTLAGKLIWMSITMLAVMAIVFGLVSYIETHRVHNEFVDALSKLPFESIMIDTAPQRGGNQDG